MANTTVVLNPLKKAIKVLTIATAAAKVLILEAEMPIIIDEGDADQAMNQAERIVAAEKELEEATR